MHRPHYHRSVCRFHCHQILERVVSVTRYFVLDNVHDVHICDEHSATADAFQRSSSTGIYRPPFAPSFTTSFARSSYALHLSATTFPHVKQRTGESFYSLSLALMCRPLRCCISEILISVKCNLIWILVELAMKWEFLGYLTLGKQPSRWRVLQNVAVGPNLHLHGKGTWYQGTKAGLSATRSDDNVWWMGCGGRR
jgi:hypothetical protein